jgi:multidrug efflux system membrane fusion protein
MDCKTLVLAFCGALLNAASGCQRHQPALPAPELPVVPVSQPVQREVNDHVDFTGRTEAVQSVDIRRRVTGYLVKLPFTLCRTRCHRPHRRASWSRVPTDVQNNKHEAMT